jgi:3-dehydroquinate dehydratase/shikimate dehydrogenase
VKPLQGTLERLFDLRICVTVTDETTAAVVDRMASLAPHADLFEVRADYVRDLDLPALIRARTKPIVLTCRPECEGGRFPDADNEARRRILLDAARLGFDLVDLEARAGFDDVAEAKAGRGLVLSWHDFDGTPRNLESLYRRMAGAGADIVKVAVTARSVEDLGRLFAFAKNHARARERGRPPLLTLAMGPLGVASRVLGGRYGAPFTYAAPASGCEAAPGQLPARVLAESYRASRITPRTRVFGLLGSDVLRSVSPAIHNRAFAVRGIDAVYVSLQAESMAAFARALPSLELSGFSVTRPYKQDVLRCLAAVEREAARAGSVNTVIVRDGGLHGSSTDGDGVLVPLRRRVDVAGSRVAIVGAGGAARSAAFALERAGAHVTVVARRREQAAEVAASTGTEHAALDELDALRWDVLIHATPLGSGALPGLCPVPPEVLKPPRVVLDMVYEPRETPLLAAARKRGCRTIDGLEMLVAQAVGQFEAWTGVPAPEAAMAEAAAQALAEATPCRGPSEGPST